MRLTGLLPRALLLGAGLTLPLAAQSRSTGYHTAARLAAAIDSIGRANPQLVRVTTLATSPGGRPVHVLRIGSSDEKPALLVLAGAYGPQIASSEVALRLTREVVTRAARDAATKALLADYTIYVVPRLNPDAAEAFFAPLKHERRGNDEKSDDDRDHAMDEDAADDLNGDGLITMMRVRTGPGGGGEWIPDAVDPALMRRADALKGEQGLYKIYVEGKDDDGDGQYNEDGPGGTDLSINFANNYQFFAAGSGEHQFSAAETRAVAEFVTARTNLAAVYVLGMQDNLIKPWEGRRTPGIGGSPQGTSAGGPYTSILPDDATWYAEVGKKAPRPVTGVDPVSAPENGDPLSWAYYHMGRFAFGTRVWWPGRAPADSGAGRRAPTPDPLTTERNEYRWLKANDPMGFVEWKEVAGYTIDGKPVEVGGFAPYARLNPPAATLDSLGAQQAGWVLDLTKMLPKAQLAGPVSVTSVGPRVWRVTADVVNTSYLPTNSALGARSRLPRRVKVELSMPNGVTLSSGRKQQYIESLRGSGATQRFEWVVVGDAGATLTLNVGAPNTGAVTETITLRAR